MGLKLLLIALQQEGNLFVFLPQGFVEVVNLFEQGLLDGLGQSSDIADSVLRLPD